MALGGFLVLALVALTLIVQLELDKQHVPECHMSIILKKKHSLKGKTLLLVIRQLKNVDPSSMREYARVNASKSIEDMDFNDVIKHIKESVDDNTTPEEILEFARKEANLQNYKFLLHILILQSNEFGQPKGQDLVTPHTQRTADETNVQTKRKRNDEADKDENSGNLEKNWKIIERMQLHRPSRK
ncbi:hypothetical protein KUTeg_019480 [Tegillarca granosa]|uniref:Uncharacterized protein n=1 Tax=Tegillarca granosa TaxID=220873 RepID=A0ABQ9ECN9_TEGGR|nr:hypothetical protein KUTeg_019480 [Tegillarca granosa]